uniref:Uncharacterized protein n=1 Tax=Avena sativa TaxID=4498 RepID=A0ACD6A1B0_AVESA
MQQAFLGRGARPPTRPAPVAATPTRPALPAATVAAPAPTRTFRRLTSAEQLERRRKGLCFNCDEPYASGHTCARMFYLETVDDAEVEALTAELDTTTLSEAGVTTYGPVDATAFVVSLHALAGIKTAKTMLLPVTINGERLTALVDTGSTHNFLSRDAMRRLALQPAGAEKFSVAVANGDRLTCHGMARQVPVLIGDEPFSINCVGIDLGCYDFILGVDFLSTLGPILWDLDVLSLIFWRAGGRRVQWTGIDGSGTMTPQLQLMATVLDEAHPLLADLLQQHSDIFDEPQGLPPARPCDHRIHLLPDTTPVAVRPYRYPQLQKDELERQVAVMLAQGIIRISTSPFSAPVLLVRKLDGTWCFCIDYRALNAMTSKDKFPIPVVDELLDELHGARFFTKLDLRSGYHQVRMHPDDIEKTAFRTHHGHFEFLVMPFGLSNAPTTFQALMNDAEHLQHVAIIFNELRAHRLHLKRSKCSFGTTSVAYLGHVISMEGVAMDADKVAVVAAWPTPRSPRALRGFLGLAGYYRKYIRDFGLIAAPLTRLLRRDAFSWDEEATTVAKGRWPSSAAPSPLAITSSRHTNASLSGWSRQCAIGDLTFGAGRSVCVRTTTASSSCWTSASPPSRGTSGSALFGFDFTVEYRPGRLNTVADALSRRDTEDVTDDVATAGAVLCIRSGPSFAFIDDIRRATSTAADAQALRRRLDTGELGAPWRLDDGLLIHGRRLFVPDHDDMRHQVLSLAHSAGHEACRRPSIASMLISTFPVMVRWSVTGCGHA